MASEGEVRQTLPSLTSELAQVLVDSCDYIDYVFYDLPVSMNFSEKPGIMNSISHIGAPSATLIPDCKPAGRIYYHVDGKIRLEADLYFNEKCKYYTFFLPKDRKPRFGNLMTAAGEKFMYGMFDRVKMENLK